MFLRSLHRCAFHRLGVDKIIHHHNVILPIIIRPRGNVADCDPYPRNARVVTMRASSNTMPKKDRLPSPGSRLENAKFRDHFPICSRSSVKPCLVSAFERITDRSGVGRSRSGPTFIDSPHRMARAPNLESPRSARKSIRPAWPTPPQGCLHRRLPFAMPPHNSADLLSK